MSKNEKSEIIAKLKNEKLERAKKPKYVRVGVPLEIPFQEPKKEINTVSGKFGDYEKVTFTYSNIVDLSTNEVGPYEIAEYLHDQIFKQFEQKDFPDKIIFVRKA